MWKILNKLMDPAANGDGSGGGGGANNALSGDDKGAQGGAAAAGAQAAADPKGGQQQQQQTQAISAADARKLMANFVADEKAVEGWDDARFVSEATRIQAGIDKVRPPAKAQAGTWPDDWREKYAEKDEAKLNILKRYNSPQAVFDALIEAKARLSKGITAALPKDAKPEEVAEFRKANGIPDKPEDYKVELADGRVIGDADKPFVADFLKEMHSIHARPELVNQALNFHFANVEKQVAKRQEQDAQERDAVVEELRQEFGADYKRNMNLTKSFLNEAGKEVFGRLMGARDETGKLLLNDPQVVRWFGKLAREINPISAYLPGGDESAVKAMSDEIKSIEALMGDVNGPYWKGPKADDYQKRYRELISIRDKANEKKKAA